MTRVFRQRHEDEPQSRRLRVLLVEHHPLIREGLRRFLEMESDGESVREAQSGEEALRVARHWLPDIAIIDLALPPRGGIATVQHSKCSVPRRPSWSCLWRKMNHTDERCLGLAPQHSCGRTGTGKPSSSRCARSGEPHRAPWLDDTGSPSNGGGDLVSPLSTTRSFA